MHKVTDTITQLANENGKSMSRYMEDAKHGNYIILCDGKAVRWDNGLPVIYSDAEEVLRELETYVGGSVVTEYTYWTEYAESDDGQMCGFDAMEHEVLNLATPHKDEKTNIASLARPIAFGNKSITGVWLGHPLHKVVIRITDGGDKTDTYMPTNHLYTRLLHALYNKLSLGNTFAHE